MSDDHLIGKDINRKDMDKIKKGLSLSNDGKIDHLTYHHEELMDQMIKAIEFTKLDKKIRSILLLRLIHGFSIHRMQIWLFLHGHITGNSHDELVAMEIEGKRLVMETLKNNSMQDIISSVNATPSIITGLRNELSTPRKNLGLT